MSMLVYLVCECCTDISTTHPGRTIADARRLAKAGGWTATGIKYGGPPDHDWCPRCSKAGCATKAPAERGHA